MNFTLNVFGVISLLIIMEKASGKEKKVVIEDSCWSPFALIKKHGQETLVPAMPAGYHRFGNNSGLKFTYYYDDLNEKFLTACSAGYFSWRKLFTQRKWRKKDYIVNDGSVLFAKINSKIQTECDRLATPTVKQSEEICSASNDVFYEVGYLVSTDEKEAQVQFISLYKICYSTTNGVLYSFHHIQWPDLLPLKEPKHYHMGTPFPTDLDEKLKENFERFQPEEDYLFYNLVELYNLPTRFYQRAAYLLMNYIRIPRHASLLNGLATYEHFVRVYGKETNKQLTIYSGNYVDNQVSSLWRIIKDPEDNGVIIITQYTLVKCDSSKLLCVENSTMLREYPRGGCTYMCSNVDETMIDKLGLPKTVKISGYLDLKFPISTKASESTPTPTSEPPIHQYVDTTNQKKSTNANKSTLNPALEQSESITDLVGAAVVLDALNNVDPGLGLSVQNNLSPVIIDSYTSGYNGDGNGYNGGNGGGYDGGNVGCYDGGYSCGDAGGGGGGGCGDF